MHVPLEAGLPRALRQGAQQQPRELLALAVQISSGGRCPSRPRLRLHLRALGVPAQDSHAKTARHPSLARRQQPAAPSPCADCARTLFAQENRNDILKTRTNIF